jgi:hypothetical protein
LIRCVEWDWRMGVSSDFRTWTCETESHFIFKVLKSFRNQKSRKRSHLGEEFWEDKWPEQSVGSIKLWKSLDRLSKLSKSEPQMNNFLMRIDYFWMKGASTENWCENEKFSPSFVEKRKLIQLKRRMIQI